MHKTGTSNGRWLTIVEVSRSKIVSFKRLFVTALKLQSNNKMSKTEEKWGVGLSQDDLMDRDTVLVVDSKDNVIGSASKKDSHVLNYSHPHGILHRAFSVFLFDESDGRLLIHQRAADKITFPNVCETWSFEISLSGHLNVRLSYEP